jgi:hypothetical protein
VTSLISEAAVFDFFQESDIRPRFNDLRGHKLWRKLKCVSIPRPYQYGVFSYVNGNVLRRSSMNVTVRDKGCSDISMRSIVNCWCGRVT